LHATELDDGGGAQARHQSNRFEQIQPAPEPGFILSTTERRIGGTACVIVYMLRESNHSDCVDVDTMNRITGGKGSDHGLGGDSSGRQQR